MRNSPTKKIRPVGVGALLGVLLVSLALTSVSSASQAPEFQFQFPPAGEDEPSAAAGHFKGPTGIAASPSGNEVYVADTAANRVSVFTAWGKFKRAFGWGVADGTSHELQTCTSPCFEGVAGGGAGQMNAPHGLAVDSTGDVYVAEPEGFRFSKFTPGGQFILTVGRAVDKTTGGNICTAASGDECQTGSPGSGPGEFQEGELFGPNIGISPDDTIYVGDKGRIEEFEANGGFKGQIAVAENKYVSALTVDPSTGDLYFAYRQFMPTDVDHVVHKLSPGGTELCAADVTGAGSDYPAPVAVAADPEGNLYVAVTTAGTADIVAFDDSCIQTAVFGRQPFTSYGIEGLGTNSIGDLYAAVVAYSSHAYVGMWGPLPSQIEPAPEEPPTIAAQYASAVGATNAVLKAQVNPHFFGSTTVYVEYGAEDCSAAGSSCVAVPAPPGISLGGGEKDANITSPGISLQGLAPGTTYYFRVVAVSGSHITRGLGAGEDGPSSTFTTRRVTTPGLPDGRVYEKVTPGEKNFGEVVPVPPAGGSVQLQEPKPIQATPTGEAITYTAFASFGEAEGAPGATQYLSRRSEMGWQTTNLAPAGGGYPPQDPIRGLSEDLTKSAVVQHDPQLLPGATSGIDNLYLENNETGGLQLATTEPPDREDPSAYYCIGFYGGSANFSHLIFSARGAFAGAPEGAGQSLYEWTSSTGIRLVSVLPNGEPVSPGTSVASRFGSGTGTECRVTRSTTHNAISADGSRIFWTYGGEYAGSDQPLFARVDGTKTVQLDANQGGVGPSGNGRYWGASNDGSKVFFTDPNKLVSGAKAGDLYLYDFNASEGKRLTDLTKATSAANPQGVVAIDSDGAHVYFVATGELASGATKGAPNLYLWTAGEGIRFVAVLSGAGDVSDWGGEVTSPNEGAPEFQTARVSPDGHYLAFQSEARLTGYDNTSQGTNEPVSEVYLYDADSETVRCASCNASGARPLGSSTVPTWSTPFEQPRYLSDDGKRLFFQTYDALVQQDANGKQDVYEFEFAGTGSCTSESPFFDSGTGGCTFLVSSGQNGDQTYLLDASSDGRDVFISTRQSLLAEDVDGRYDIYDARVGGGISSAAPAPAPCEGEGCRGASSVTPGDGVPPSSVYSGPGNLHHRAKKHRKRHRHRHHRRGAHHKRGGAK